MKVCRTLRDGSVKEYEYDRRKYYQPREKQGPKYKRLSQDIKRLIFRLHKLGVSVSSICRIINTEPSYDVSIGRKSVTRLLNDEKEIALFKNGLEAAR